MKAEELCIHIDSGVPFLKQVLNRLARASLVRARPGRKGGYQLAHNPQRLFLSTVVQAVDGRDVRQQCLFDPTACDGTKACRLSQTWHPIRESLIAFVETETIHSVADRCQHRAEMYKRSDLNERMD